MSYLMNAGREGRRRRMKVTEWSTSYTDECLNSPTKPEGLVCRGG